MDTASNVVGVSLKQQYQDEGYMVLESVISAEHLQMLRDECDQLIADVDAEMDRLESDVHGLSQRGRRYFISSRSRDRPRLRDFLFSNLMAGICRDTIGGTAYLFVEQFVVKAAEVGTSFSWHQDSGFIDFPHDPYVSCWCTLDDVDERNGTVYILPYSRAGTSLRVDHVIDPSTNDRVGYHGEDPGDPVIAPAGSIVVFSSTAFHRTGPNTTERARRVYLAQYARQPITSPNGDQLNMAEPFPSV